MRRLMLPLLALAVSGCVVRHGERLQDVTPALSPRGVATRLTLANKLRIDGELLFVNDTALYVLESGTMRPSRKILRARLTDIREARVGRQKLSEPFRGDTAKLRIIRQRSRFSYSLSPEQLQNLLAEYGQSGVTETMPAAPNLEAFLSQVQRAVATLGTVEEAIAAGYRRVGPEFPGMGQHWVHPGLVVSGTIDPARPPVLAFARFASDRRLVAVAFTMPLAAHESPPDHPVGAHVWHDHTGLVDEEVLLISHPVSTHSQSVAPRLAMFHAWIGVENRDGVTAQNNWDLPFVQLGLPPPRQPSMAAAHAVALLTAGVEYYERLYTVAAGLSSREVTTMRTLLRDAHDRVEQWRLRRGDSTVHELELIWSELWQQLQQALPAAQFARLAPFAPAVLH